MNKCHRAPGICMPLISFLLPISSHILILNGITKLNSSRWSVTMWCHNATHTPAGLLFTVRLWGGRVPIWPDNIASRGDGQPSNTFLDVWFWWIPWRSVIILYHDAMRYGAYMREYMIGDPNKRRLPAQAVIRSSTVMSSNSPSCFRRS